MSSGNLVTLRYLEEVTYNLTPANDAGWKTIRYTSEDVSATPQTNQSQEVRSDRMTSDQFLTTTEVSGGFSFELSADTFDDLMEGAMCNTWATDVLEIGTDEISYSIEGEFTDLTTNEFKQFTGMRVNTMSLTFSGGEPINGSFSFAGAGADVTDVSLVGAGSTANPTTTEVMNGVSDITSIKIDTVTFTGCIQSITLEVNNNLRPSQCIGSDTPSDQLLGTALVTGTIEAYLSDATMLWYKNNVLGQVAMEIEFTASDGTNSYTFLIPNAKVSGTAPASGGLDTDVMITAEFTALYDGTEGTSLKITRV